MDASQKFGLMLACMVGDDVSDNELFRLGYRAFLNCADFGDMPSQLERDGWEAARRDILAQGIRIAQRGTR